MEEHLPMPNADDDNELFPFETDHVALRGNKDYSEVLKTLITLTAFREKMLKDYKIFSEARNEMLKDPIGTLEKIENGIDLGIPALLKIPELPKIDFSKYNVTIPESVINEIYNDQTEQNEEKIDLKNMNAKSNNRTWSTEEQKRLEELLKIYPPEPVEARRYEKIAKALGNRTLQQVASRVQKYFLKLYKAGLPIPGRIPKSIEKYKKSALHKHQRHNHYLWKPTTFFPELNVPVQMDNLDDIPGPSISSSNSSLSANAGKSTVTEDNYLLCTDYHQDKLVNNGTENDDDLKINLLKRIRQEKVKENSDNFVPFSHIGFKCNYCEETPIVGARWHCVICRGSIDFCTDCVLSQLYSENPHPLKHWLAVILDELENYSLPDHLLSCENNNGNSNDDSDKEKDFKYDIQFNDPNLIS